MTKNYNSSSESNGCGHGCSKDTSSNNQNTNSTNSKNKNSYNSTNKNSAKNASKNASNYSSSSDYSDNY